MLRDECLLVGDDLSVMEIVGDKMENRWCFGPLRRPVDRNLLTSTAGWKHLRQPADSDLSLPLFAYSLLTRHTRPRSLPMQRTSKKVTKSNSHHADVQSQMKKVISVTQLRQFGQWKKRSSSEKRTMDFGPCQWRTLHIS
jgi:hypothetical protein